MSSHQLVKISCKNVKLMTITKVNYTVIGEKGMMEIVIKMCIIYFVFLIIYITLMNMCVERGLSFMKKQTNDTFLRAIRGEQTGHVPVWFMRQAGRSQPEYREIKQKYSLFEITHQPELCAYVTRLPVEQYGVDAAILYKNIMTPLPAMGVDVEIKNGIGPVISNPITSLADVEKLGEIHPEEDVPYVLETIKILTKEQLTVPLIGFSGAPFTLASYMIEGGPSKNYTKTKAFMYAEPKAWFA